MLDALYHTDSETGCLCRYVHSDTEYFRPHCHNYYEIFMIVKGDVCHMINGTEQILREGQILFIRDFDCHDYKSIDGEYFELINLAFTAETFCALKAYLGEDFPFDALISSPQPPSACLSHSEKERLFNRLLELNLASDKKLIKTKARSLLASIFADCFYRYQSAFSEIPLWLEATYEKMKKPENFISGLTRMYELSGKSREHLSRSMKKHYGISPAGFVTGLRLEYAANLLVTGNMSVTDICFESGFENLSWFYKLFSSRYNLSPVMFRNRYSAR